MRPIKRRGEKREADFEDVDSSAYEGARAGEVIKADPVQRNVFGWAYITHDKDGVVNIDKSGDFVDDPEELEKGAYDYVLHSRKGDADHTNVQGGTLIESIVFTPEKIEKMGNQEAYGMPRSFPERENLNLRLSGLKKAVSFLYEKKKNVQSEQVWG